MAEGSGAVWPTMPRSGNRSAKFTEIVLPITVMQFAPEHHRSVPARRLNNDHQSSIHQDSEHVRNVGLIDRQKKQINSGALIEKNCGSEHKQSGCSGRSRTSIERAVSRPHTISAQNGTLKEVLAAKVSSTSQ